MANIEIITAEQTSQWHQQIVKAGCSDVYFFPEYARIFDAIEGGTTHLFVYEEECNIFIYSFRLRKLSLIDQFAEFSDWFDITSNYGYGGPVVSVSKKNEAQAFIKNALYAFNEYCAKNRIVSEFCRFHPLLENAQYLKNVCNPIFCNHTVWVDLTLSEEECWRRMRRNHRQDIRRTEKLGAEIEISDTVDTADVFYDLYIQTMKDVGANSYYFFNKNFFRNTLQLLTGHAMIFLSRYQGKVIGGVLYIWGDQFAHAHFSAMDRTFTYLRPSKMLHYQAILYSKRKGLKKLHLGGGVCGSETDTLMHFKAGFSKLRADYYIGKRIHNYDVYCQLCAKVNVDPEVESFFPAYRAI